MQRVRIGLTGLAFVFLAVLLAAVFTRNPTREAPITSNEMGQQKAGVTVVPQAGPAVARPSDPLAQLGVAPGNTSVAQPSTVAPAGPALATPPASAPAR